MNSGLEAMAGGWILGFVLAMSVAVAASAPSPRVVLVARVAVRVVFAVAAAVFLATLALTYRRPNMLAITGAALLTLVAFCCMRLVSSWRQRPDDGRTGENDGGGGGGGPRNPGPPPDWGEFDRLRERWERTPSHA